MGDFSNCVKCGGDRVDHEQEHVTYEKYDFCVDKGLADLLKLLWSHGVETNFSCIGGECPEECDQEACPVEMTQIVFWSDDNLKRFLDLVDNRKSTKEYELFLHISGYKKKYAIVKSLEEIFNPKEKSPVWRWEPMNAVYTCTAKDESTIEGVPIPVVYRDRIRWELRFPREDIPAIIRTITGAKYLERIINHYILENGEIKTIGSMTYKDGRVISEGIYSNFTIFDKSQAERDYESDLEYWEQAGRSYDIFLKASKQFHDTEIAKYEAGEKDITFLLKDIPESYVIIETI